MSGNILRHLNKWGTWVTPTLYLLVVFFPILILIYRAIMSGPNNFSELIFPSGRTLTLFGRSIVFAIQVSVTSLLISVPIALFLYKNNKGYLFHLRWFLLAVLAVPPEIHALSWNTSISLAMKIFGNSVYIPESWSTLVWVETVSLFPITAGMTLLALESIDGKLVEASRMMKSVSLTIQSVILPLCVPVMLASAGLVFVLCLTETTLPVLYRQNVYSFELFAEFSSGGDAVRVFLMSIPIIAAAGLGIFISQRGIRYAALTQSSEQPSIHSTSRLPGGISILFWISMLVLAVCAILPFVVLIAEAGSFTAFKSVLANSLDETVVTFKTAFFTAILAIPIGLGGAKLISRKAFWFLVVLPLAIPAPLIGIGLIETWNHPATSMIYGSAMMPVLASIARFAPLVAILLHAQQSRLDKNLIEASRMLKVAPMKKFVKVIFPLIFPGIAISLAVVFTLSVSELGASLLITPAGQTSLMMKIYNYLHYGSSSGVASLSIVLILIITTGILIQLGLSRLLFRGPKL